MRRVSLSCIARRAVLEWATYRCALRSLFSGCVVDGPDLSYFRSHLIDRLGVQEVTLCGSGSLALEIALRACGVRGGDEVILPAFCCSAIVPPILALGAVPVLADIGAELNLTAETIDAATTRKTRAVVVPHLFGNPADIGLIAELTRTKNIRLIDDAAQALGATVGDRPAGTFGDGKICFGLGGGVLIWPQSGPISTAAFDLPPPRTTAAVRKLAATQIFGRWRRWVMPLLRLRPRGMRADPYALPARYEGIGMANLQAAVAMSLVHTLDENLAARRARVEAYRELLGGEPGVELIVHRPGSACLTQVVRLRTKPRDNHMAARLIAALGEDGCEVQGSYVPIHLLGRFRECVWDALPRTERVWSELIELPCEPGVSLRDVERIAALVKRFGQAGCATIPPSAVS